jgi:SAM-dependent methyltransferase
VLYSRAVSKFVNRFAGTASYYARFRPGYPGALYDLLEERADLNHTTSVLDLGCGPGTLALGLANGAKLVIGVDPDTKMLQEATRAAASASIDNASWVLSTAEDFVGEPGIYRLITIASAFHWMDREAIAEKAYDLLEPNGVLAVIGNPTPLKQIRERRGVGAPIAEIQDRWFAAGERPGSDDPEVRPEEIIRRSSFGLAEVEHVATEQRWNVENLVGFLRSTSWRPDKRLGNKFSVFTAELEDAIRVVEPCGEWLMRDEVEVILAYR